MPVTPPWQFNEHIQVGKDYADIEIALRYDARHAKFRDLDREAEEVLARLEPTPESVLVDIGAGTGTFAVHAAPRCAKVYAVDVSEAMLACARDKAEGAGAGNIAFHHGGFLTYDHVAPPVDIVTSTAVLHHLPDFWKSIALRRINGMLKSGGRFFLADVVFTEENALVIVDKWIAHLGQSGDEELITDAQTHVREEFSTLTWIMEGLLTRAGFRIDWHEELEGAFARYLCTKVAEVKV